MSKHNIGENMKRMRADKSMTQTDLSYFSRVGIASISMLERGVTSNPRIDSLVAIAKVLDVTLDDLVK